MDRIDTRGRIRNAAMDAGILPSDPLWTAFDELADVMAKEEAARDRLLQRAEVLIDAANRAAQKPLLTDDQLRSDLIPALVAGSRFWYVIIALVLIMVSSLAGYGLRWHQSEWIYLADGRAGYFHMAEFQKPAPEPRIAPEPPAAPAAIDEHHAPVKR